MSDTTLYAAIAATLIATVWLLPMGVVRMLAYRSGEVDHTPGMRNIAWLALGLGAVSALACVILTLTLVVRGA